MVNAKGTLMLPDPSLDHGEVKGVTQLGNHMAGLCQLI